VDNVHQGNEILIGKTELRKMTIWEIACQESCISGKQNLEKLPFGKLAFEEIEFQENSCLGDLIRDIDL